MTGETSKGIGIILIHSSLNEGNTHHKEGGYSGKNNNKDGQYLPRSREKFLR